MEKVQSTTLLFYYKNIILLLSVIFVQSQVSNFSAISRHEQVTFYWDDDDVNFVLDQRD